MKNNPLVFLVVLLLTFTSTTLAQPTLQKDYSYVMEIPSVITMESSQAHLYALSDTEGMAVFRTQHDSLQWLYSSTGMEQRGNTVTADIRFAYLFGNSRRLTVLEPTSVLGVYSSTLLPSNPLDAKRIDQNLYVALGNKGLGKISLRTPASVDSTMEFVERSKLSRENIIDIEISGNQLFALSATQTLFRFEYKDGQLSLSKEIEIDGGEINSIYLINDTLLGSDKGGGIYEVDRIGYLIPLGNIDEEVTKIEAWKNWLIIKGISNRLWTSYQNRSPELWKKDGKAKNYFTVTNNDLWLCEYDKISRIVTSAEKNTESPIESSGKQPYTGSISLTKIPNQTTPHSKAVLLPIQFAQDVPAEAVQISYQSDIKNAEVRGRSFYWNPTADNIGNHRVKIIASTNSGQTDSTSFSIEVKSFNAPPRFAPIRPISIPMDDEFSLTIKATDPDGMNKNLVRFLGVNLPEGATIDEKTGTFTWTPSARQAGENKFRVIATDQYGAANSANITITVVENARQGGD